MEVFHVDAAAPASFVDRERARIESETHVELELTSPVQRCGRLPMRQTRHVTAHPKSQPESLVCLPYCWDEMRVGVCVEGRKNHDECQTSAVTNWARSSH